MADKYQCVVWTGKGYANMYRFFIACRKDSFITQDRNKHFEGRQDEATFSRGHGGFNCKDWFQMKRMDIIFQLTPHEFVQAKWFGHHNGYKLA